MSQILRNRWLPCLLAWTKAVWHGTPLPEPHLKFLIQNAIPQEQSLHKVLMAQGVGIYLAQHVPNHANLEALKNHLEQEAQMNRLRCERLSEDLELVLGAAAQAQIPIIVLKGLALALEYYSVPHTRSMADIDLLVQSQHLQAMSRVLEMLGYKATETSGGHTSFYKPDNTKTISLQHHPDNPRPVELHFELKRQVAGYGNKYDISQNAWATSTPSTLFGQPVFALEPQLLFEYLCIHASQHLHSRFGRIMHFLDLAQVAQSTPKIQSDLWLMPALEFAARGLATPDLLRLQQGLAIPYWLKNVALDETCGLCVYALPKEHFGVEARAKRFLTPWRVQFAFPRNPLWLAYIKQIYGVARQVAS
jgi:predicted RNA binding protein YcfA (HicA-like mRNA interferase family)